MLLKKLYIVFNILFYLQCKKVNSLNKFSFRSRKYNTKIINDFLHSNKKLLNNYAFLKIYRKEKTIKRKNNLKSISPNENDEDEKIGIEIENLINDIEEGKFGEDSLKLYKDIEKTRNLKEEEERNRINEQNKKIDMNNVETIINNTDETLKKCVRNAFYNTNTTETEDPDMKKQYDIMNKIGKTFDDIEDINDPDEDLNLSNIYKKINSMKGDYSNNPFKSASETLLKYKGLLHMPFEKNLLLNNDYFYWRESLTYIECYIPIPHETSYKDISIYFKNDYIKLEILRNDDKIIFLDHELYGKINYADAYWVITNDYKVNEKHINLIIPKLGNYQYIWEKLLRYYESIK